jgi:hypothetical protein
VIPLMAVFALTLELSRGMNAKEAAGAAVARA